MKLSFLAHGKHIYAKALREQHNAGKAKLQESLASATEEAERRKLVMQIMALEKSYREKLRSAKRGLF